MTIGQNWRILEIIEDTWKPLKPIEQFKTIEHNGKPLRAIAEKGGEN